MAIPDTPADEVRALSRLAWSELAGAIGGIAGFQNAVTPRVFGMLAPLVTRSRGSWATSSCSSRAPPGAHAPAGSRSGNEDGMHVGGATHFALLNHPEVYAQLRDRLAPPAG